MLKWSEKFETGHELIDAQHRMLISYINRLESLSKTTNPNREELELFCRFIEFMESYLSTHFKEEEQCMHQFRCPAHQENKASHGKFLEFFRKFKLRFAAEGYRSEMVKELFESCVDWIQEHILRIDVQLKPCQTRNFAPDQTEPDMNGSSNN